MLLDPNLILQAGRGVTPFDPVGMAQAAQQFQMQGIQLQQQRNALADAMALKQDIASANGDPEALKAALLKRGKVKEVHEMGTAAAQEEKAKLENVKAQHEAYTSLNGQQVQTLMAAKDAIARNPNQAQQVWDQTRAQLAANTQPYAKVLGIDTSKDGNPPQFPGMDFLDQKIAQGTSMDQRLKQAAQKVDADYKAWQMKHGDTQAAETARHNLAAEANMRRGQDMGVGIYGGMPGSPAARNGGTPAQPGEQPAPTGDRLAAVPAGIRDLVKQVGTYQMLPTQIGPRQKTMVMSYVAQAFPNYSIGDAEANQKFIKGLASTDAASSGGTVAASERLLGHAGELADLTDKLGNSATGKLGNILGGAFDKATGTGKAGDIKAFELTKGKVMGELNKLATGGVPHAEELASDIKQLEYSDPPEVKYKVLKAAIQLGLEQTHAVEQRRNNILGENAPQTSLLSPRAQAVVQRIYQKADGGKADLAAPTTQGYTNTAIVKAPAANPKLPYSGQSATQADLEATAKARGMSVVDVKRKWISGGGRVE